MDDIDSCIYENVTRCLASSISNSNFNSLQVGSYRTDLDIEIPSHYDVPASHYDVPNRLQFRSHSLTALNMLTTHHQLSIGSRAESSSPLSDRVEFHSVSVPGSPEAAKYRHTQHCNASDSTDMSSRDKAIYNSLGSSSSKAGKPSFALLGLTKNVIKTGVMSKTGPTPSWCAKWNRRVFVLKGSYLFYFDPVDKPLLSAPVLGGVYIKHAMIERISLAFTKRILRITPQVARRTGWDKHSHNEAFYIKFRTEAGRDEWYEALTMVSSSNSTDAIQ